MDRLGGGRRVTDIHSIHSEGITLLKDDGEVEKTIPGKHGVLSPDYLISRLFIPRRVD